MNTLNLENRAQVERMIAGALLNAIHSHGSITPDNRSSAAKRVYSQLKALAKAQRLERRKQKINKDDIFWYVFWAAMFLWFIVGLVITFQS